MSGKTIKTIKNYEIVKGSVVIDTEDIIFVWKIPHKSYEGKRSELLVGKYSLLQKKWIKKWGTLPKYIIEIVENCEGENELS